MLRNQESGFTLLEVMAAMLVFGLVLGGMAPVFGSVLKRNSDMEIRGGSIAAAQQVLDTLRLTDPNLLPSSGSSPTQTITIDGRDYLVTTTFCLEASFCSSANTRHITVGVTYKGEATFAVETVFTQLR